MVWIWLSLFFNSTRSNKKKKLKKERDRKVKRRKGKWPAGRAATGSRRLRLSPMQQLAMKMKMVFCHVFPLVLYTSSYWPSTHDQIEGSAVTGRGGLSGEVTWPVGTKLRGINKLHVRFQAVFQWHEQLAFHLLRQKSNWQAKDNCSLIYSFAL